MCLSKKKKKKKTFETEIHPLPFGSENLGSARNICRLQNTVSTIGVFLPTTPYFILALDRQDSASPGKWHCKVKGSQGFRMACGAGKTP